MSPELTGTTADFLTILAGIGSLLVVATLVGHALRRAKGETDTILNLNARINAWWGMVGLLAVALLAGKAGVVILFALLSFAALREFVTLTTRRTADHWAIAAAFFVVLPVQYGLIWADRYGIYSIFIPVYAFLALPVIAVLQGDTRQVFVRMSELQWALMICVYCASHVPALLYLQIPGFDGRGVLLIAFLILVVQLSDVAQYVWGKLAGRRKLAPTLSPSKTWEGFLGGIATATLVGTGLWWITPFQPWQAALMSLAICLAGVAGGLVMSAIKRDRGVKDWGHLIAGHGGFVDRLDSVVFAAPIFFHLTRFFWSAT
jgi:phosphatidate cytidylyltransferase